MSVPNFLQEAINCARSQNTSLVQIAHSLGMKSTRLYCLLFDKRYQLDKKEFSNSCEFYKNIFGHDYKTKYERKNRKSTNVSQDRKYWKGFHENIEFYWWNNFDRMVSLCDLTGSRGYKFNEWQYVGKTDKPIRSKKY